LVNQDPLSDFGNSDFKIERKSLTVYLTKIEAVDDELKMMNLEGQIQALLQNAPDDREMRQITEIFVSVLRQFASKLRHIEYHVLQTMDQDWVSFTLNYRTQSDVEKTVIYAFSSAEDVSLSISAEDLADLTIVRLGIIALLFQFFTLNLGETIVFFDQPGQLDQGIEFSRREFEQALRQSVDPPPTDIA
jgi:hypothetical protein